MIPVTPLRPFTRFLMTIGEIPTSYLISMTYEEQLLWFCNYLEKTVIPAIDNNAEAVKELQDLYVELKSYVDNYFENLDVQEEINNKLDEMAESGQLADIIAQYLGLAGVLAYDTISNMASATNIAEGSICKTLGETTYNDGKGAFYKVRTVTSGDVVDGVNIVALSVSNTLIAERIPDYRLNQLENSVTGFDSRISSLEVGNINEEIVIIGDSYLAGQSLTNPTTENFGYLLMQKLGMNTNNFHIWAEGGSSFVIAGNQGHTWDTLITSKIGTLSDPTKITKVILAGGYNDVNASSGSQIETAMASCIANAKTSFPNAKIYLTLIANNGANTAEGATARNTLKNRVFNTYSKCSNYGAIFIDKGYLPLQDYTLFESSAVKVHPNASGHIEIANYLYQALLFGTIDYRRDNNAFNATIPSGMNGTLIFAEKLFNNKIILTMQCNLTLPSSLAVGYSTVNLGSQSFKFLKYNSYPAGGVKSAWFTIGASDSGNNPVPINARGYLNPSNELVIEYYNTSSNKNRIVSAAWVEMVFDVQTM